MVCIVFLVVVVFVFSGCVVINMVYVLLLVMMMILLLINIGLSIYMYVVCVLLYSEFFVCNSYGLNFGFIGQCGEVMNYMFYIEMFVGLLLCNLMEIVCFLLGFGFCNIVSGGGCQYNGFDFVNCEGGFIYVVVEGCIVIVEYCSGYGNYIEIDYGYGVCMCYVYMVEFDLNLCFGMCIVVGVVMG